VAADRCEKAGVELRIPAAGLCTDNGAMVVVGVEQILELQLLVAVPVLVVR
jgi:tRNA A37 threonylcarbamoyltransferase TsaD